MTPRLNLQWQRKLRVTELQPLHILSSICSKVVLLYDQINRRCWNFDTIGNYTVKFECITICKRLCPGVFSISSLLWKGLVYPKIQAFLWQLMHEKLCAREFLASKHIISHQQMTCPTTTLSNFTDGIIPSVKIIPTEHFCRYNNRR
jgi:hypothetical protein